MYFLNARCSSYLASLLRHLVSQVDFFFCDAEVFAEFGNGDELVWHFVVDSFKLRDYFSGIAVASAGDDHNVFGMDPDSVHGDLFLDWMIFVVGFGGIGKVTTDLCYVCLFLT